MEDTLSAIRPVHYIALLFASAGNVKLIDIMFQCLSLCHVKPALAPKSKK